MGVAGAGFGSRGFLRCYKSLLCVKDRRFKSNGRFPFCGLIFRCASSAKVCGPPVLSEKMVRDGVPPRVPRPAFLDYQSTTPLDPRVLDKMLPLMTDVFGNPHSRSHAYGWEAKKLVEEARQEVASVIGAQSPKTIIFTSGATESNNMAIKGAAGFYGKQKDTSTGSSRKYNHVITIQIEHKCVLASARTLQEQGWEVTFLPVKSDGIIDLQEFEKAIRPNTLLASVMFVNNEIGVIQPVEEVGKLCKKYNILFHTDAAQAVGKMEVDVDKIGADLLSISGHKLYGPKGVGALFVRNKPKRVRLIPLIDGGGQERGFRSGTLPAPLIVGLGEACRVAKAEMEADRKYIRFLSSRLYDGIFSQVEDVVLNGSPTHRYHGNVNISFSCVEGESLLMSLNNIAVSSGSACTSESLEPSYVLRAIGVNEELAHTSLRFGLGRFTTVAEIDDCIHAVKKHVTKLRDMSPLWELHQLRKSGQNVDEMVWT